MRIKVSAKNPRSLEYLIENLNYWPLQLYFAPLYCEHEMHEMNDDCYDSCPKHGVCLYDNIFVGTV